MHVENSCKPVTLLINIYIGVGANSSGGRGIFLVPLVSVGVYSVS